MKYLFASCIFTFALLFGTQLLAADYIPMVTIPGVNSLNSTGTLEQYVNALYVLAISVAALLAVVQIIFGGVQWMLSDVVTDKSSAKKRIRGALLGLLIVLTAVVILNTINANLTNLEFFKNAPPPTEAQNNERNASILNTVINDPNDQRYSTNPTVSVCGTGNARSCETISRECRGTAGYVTHQQTEQNSITCFIRQ